MSINNKFEIINIHRNFLIQPDYSVKTFEEVKIMHIQPTVFFLLTLITIVLNAKNLKASRLQENTKLLTRLFL